MVIDQMRIYFKIAFSSELSTDPKHPDPYYNTHLLLSKTDDERFTMNPGKIQLHVLQNFKK
jgi:hypothetical protein